MGSQKDTFQLPFSASVSYNIIIIIVNICHAHLQNVLKFILLSKGFYQIDGILIYYHVVVLVLVVVVLVSVVVVISVVIVVVVVYAVVVVVFIVIVIV